MGSIIKEILINPEDINYKFIASEIVRAMTNLDLTSDQKDGLECVSEEVIRNHLNNKTVKYTKE